MLRLGRFAPLLLATLFALRIAACDAGDNHMVSGTAGSPGGAAGGDTGGTTGGGGRGGEVGRGGEAGGDAGATAGVGGRGGAAGSSGERSGTCSGTSVQYMSGGQLLTHPCVNSNCYLTATNAGCISVPGVVPFQTCATADDCYDATYCPTVGATSETMLSAPICTGGVCDWQMQAVRACPSGLRCNAFGCGAGGGGGNSGLGGSGTTSGGFPWGNGGGGSSGTNPGTGGGTMDAAIGN